MKLTDEQKAKVQQYRAEDEAKHRRKLEVIVREGIDKMTDEELRANLLTLDFKGPEVKDIVLNELLCRAITEAFEEGFRRGQE
jgi:hypothetical protein